MPDIAKVLKEEVLRLARKEVRAATANLRKDTVTLKRAVADHKRRLAKLERDNKRLVSATEKTRKETLVVSDGEVQRARISGHMVRSIRTRLKLSQADFATLVGVNPQTVYQWERKGGRLRFRGGAKTAIIEVRKLKAAEAQEQLDRAKVNAKGKKKKRRSRKK